MNETSNIPTGGITRRTGRSTGSVRSKSSVLTDARNVPPAHREPREHGAAGEDDQVDRTM